ncbi:MAG: cation transporter [Betaproteobacteria bacterium HGW-Betaproteobacteria-11]|nr:MAG: cation transporter [Betaproteobacteria bacterium HGW-Betaproteobacteria-11]
MKPLTVFWRGVSFALLWWVLAEGRMDGWWVGLCGVAAATWASLRLSPPRAGRLRAVPLLRFLAFFLWNSVRGGWQVARLALRPRLDLAPTTLDLAVMLPAGGARQLMLNTLSLMPGTVGVGLDDATLRLHVLDSRLPVAREARALEAHIARLFEVAP